MKMTRPDRQELLRRIRLAARTHGIDIARVRTERERWQLFHLACPADDGFTRSLYAYCSDAHIDTGLRWAVGRRGPEGENQ